MYKTNRRVAIMTLGTRCSPDSPPCSLSLPMIKQSKSSSEEGMPTRSGCCNAGIGLLNDLVKIIPVTGNNVPKLSIGQEFQAIRTPSSTG